MHIREGFPLLNKPGVRTIFSTSVSMEIALDWMLKDNNLGSTLIEFAWEKMAHEIDDALFAFRDELAGDRYLTVISPSPYSFTMIIVDTRPDEAEVG